MAPLLQRFDDPETERAFLRAERKERARQQKIPGYSYLAAVRGAPSQWLQREEEPAPSNKDS